MVNEGIAPGSGQLTEGVEHHQPPEVSHESHISDHPYVIRKDLSGPQLSGLGCYIENTIIGPFQGPALFRPLFDSEGQPAGSERILPEKIAFRPDDKPNDKFVSKGSVVSGTFTPIGFTVSSLDSLERLVICNGLAEGCRLHEALMLPVACGVGDGSIKSIAAAISDKHPHIRLVAAVDNDESGIKAGKESGLTYSHPQSAKDWSDVYQQSGSDGVLAEYQEGLIAPEVGPFDLSRASVMDLLDTTPPPREWLVRDRLPLWIVGILAAAGGTGKSMATLQLAVSVCTGLEWLEHAIETQGAVLILSAEDDREEVHRRLAAVISHYAEMVDPTDQAAFRPYLNLIKKRLFIFDRVGDDNRLTAKVDRETRRTALAQSIIGAANQINNCVLIVLDPLSRFDGGDPNDNSDGTRLIESAETIRRETGATVLLPHHVSKAGIRDTQSGQEAVRGASGLVDGARWVGLLSTMRADDAESYGIDPDDAGRYVRFRTPKNNYGPPWEGAWLERRAGGILSISDLKPEKEAKGARKSEVEYQELVRRISELIEKKGPMAKRRIEDEYGGSTNILKAGQKKVRNTITRAIEEGLLVRMKRFDGQENIGVPEINQTERAA